MNSIHPVTFIALSFLLVCITNANGEATGSTKVHRDLIYANTSEQKLKLDLYIPSDVSDPVLVVWIHGGGWRAGSRKNPKLLQLTNHGYAVASISYRFTDKAIFPAQIHDCKAAIRWLRANSDKYGYHSDWIAVAGSSAGGHLALLLGTSGGDENLEGEIGEDLSFSSDVQAIIDYYGPSDFVLRGKTQPERAYTDKSGSYALLGGKDKTIPKEQERFASPAAYVSQDDPPLLIFHGTNDKTVLLDQSEHIANLYKTSGLAAQLVVIPDAGHGGKKFFEGENFQKVIQFLKQTKKAASTVD